MDCERLCVVLQELSSSIQQLASSPSNFILHRTQCCCLSRSYAITVDHVSQQLHHTLSVCNDRPSLENLLPSLSELHHAMLRGHKFMQDCSFQDGWVRKAVILAFSSDAQDVCLHDLVWCICVIRQAMCQLLPSAVFESEDDVFNSLNAIWADMSPRNDLMTLINALNHDIAHWEHHVSRRVLPTDLQEDLKTQCCLAKFLFRKLLREINFQDVVGTASYDTLLECLWVDPLEFSIKESIGHGAYAVVYEVEWYGHSYGQKEFFGVDKNCFGKEAAIQARLRHPNVLQLICCTSKPSRNTCSLVTELMDTDLRRILDNRCKDGFDPPFPILTAVDLMLQIAKGMEYLHGLHIMHRDLKSPNVLVKNHVSTEKAHDDGRMQVKVADFGMSKAKYASSKYTTLHAGTTYWRAPEVFKVDLKRELERKYSKKADVYSFAMVCYEILTGKIPFDDGGKLTKLSKRLLRGERPTLPNSCPQYLASYIERCWHSNPEKRPSFAQVSRTLRHLKGILLTSASPFSSLALTGRSCTIIEDKLEQTIGADWISTVSRGFTTSRSMAITFEMSWYKVMESKLMEKVVPAPRIKISSKGSRCLMCCCIVLACGGHLRKKKIRSGNTFGPVVESSGNGIREEIQRLQYFEAQWYPVCLRRFTYAELDRATNHFSGLLGRGGAGSVYKATLADGLVVAVKVFSERSRRVFGEEFLKEIDVLGRIRHRNLVPLLGFCCDGDLLLLVYKFMPGGDLENLRRHGRALTWAQKYNIVRGLASALDYLHNGCSPPVLHRDVKPSNILLDDNQEAYLADFGIARYLSNRETHVTTALMGTMGYIAPEYIATLKLGTEADVYSFGVVVLELACGRGCIERDAEIPHIVEYVWTMYQQKTLFDATHESIRRGGHPYDEEELHRVLHVGLACTHSNSRDRPTMCKVVQILSKQMEAPIPVHLPYYMNAQVHEECQPRVLMGEFGKCLDMTL